jgi:hypothetical protein
MDLLWLLNLADGHQSLLDMAIRADIPFARLQAAARLALEASLVRETSGDRLKMKRGISVPEAYRGDG